MADLFRDRRFVLYLVLTNLVLVALAFAGPVWFACGLVGLVSCEVLASMRNRDQTPAFARAARR